MSLLQFVVTKNSDDLTGEQLLVVVEVVVTIKVVLITMYDSDSQAHLSLNPIYNIILSI